MNSTYQESVDAVRANTLYFILTAAFGALLVWDAMYIPLVTFAPLADYWEHAALLTEWLNNFSDPANPHVNDPSLSSGYMPLYWVLTLIGVTLGLDAFDLLAISAVFNYVLIAIGLHLFLKNYFRDNWAPVLGYIAIFLCWGISWNWPNLYHMPSFFYVAGYPSSFVFGLSLVSFYISLRLMRREGSELTHAILLCFLTALMFVSDPLTGVFGVVGCGLLALLCRSDGIGLRLIALFAVLMGLFFAEQWPYFSPWNLSLGLYGSGMEQWSGAEEGMGILERLRSGVWEHIFYSPELVFTIIGPALLGLPLCIWLLIRGDYIFIVCGAAIMAVPYLLHPFIEVPLAHRFLLFVVTYFQFAIVAAGLAIKESWFTRPRPPLAVPLMLGMLGFIAVLIVLNIYLFSIEFSGSTLNPKTLEIEDKHGQLPESKSVVEIYQQLTQPLADDSVVLATPMHGWPLPAVKGKVVSLYHENPMLIDQQQRYAETMRFFEQSLSDAERTQVIGDYRPDHLLLVGQPATSNLTTWLNRHALLVAKVGDYRMFRLRDTASAGYVPPPPPEETAEEAASGDISFVEEAPDEPVAAPVSLSEPVVKPRPVPQPSTIEDSGADPVPVRPDTSVAPDIGAFGAPLNEPMITEPEEIPAELPEDLVVEKLQPEVEERQVPEEVIKEQDRPLNYGVPITEPLLDPSRQGGE
ncbi:MAG: hypothetical protein ACR2QG_00095 [Gammaproteobacteria bacterium]